MAIFAHLPYYIKLHKWKILYLSSSYKTKEIEMTCLAINIYNSILYWLTNMLMHIQIKKWENWDTYSLMVLRIQYQVCAWIGIHQYLEKETLSRLGWNTPLAFLGFPMQLMDALFLQLQFQFSNTLFWLSPTTKILSYITILSYIQVY